LSFDVEFIPGPRAIQGDAREIESQVAYAWEAAGLAIGGESGVDALEDAGMSVTWSPSSLSVSIPYSVDPGVAECFNTLVEHVERQLRERLGWVVDEENSNRA
jgi:hypothetical protein